MLVKAGTHKSSMFAIRRSKTHPNFCWLLAAKYKHVIIFLKLPCPHLNVPDPAWKIADLKCVSEDLLSAMTFVADVIRSAVSE